LTLSNFKVSLLNDNINNSYHIYKVFVQQQLTTYRHYDYISDTAKVSKGILIISLYMTHQACVNLQTQEYIFGIFITKITEERLFAQISLPT